MAGDLNRVIMIGRLTRDPELKATNSGTTVTRFSLASNRLVKGKDGNWTDQAGFFDCVAFGKTGETIGKFFQKGRKIAIEGSLSWSSWENSEGKKQSKVEIIVDSFNFMDSKNPSGSGDSYDARDSFSPAPTNDNTYSDIGSSFPEDDVPF